MTTAMKKQLQAESFKRAEFTFSVNTAPGWRLSTALASAGVTKKARIRITINAGVSVGGIIIDTAPAGSLIKVINNGNLVGAIGSGTALTVNVPIRLVNNGMIAGGGGNGGKGGDGQHGGLSAGRACTLTALAGGAAGTGAGMSGVSLINETAGAAGPAASDSAARGGLGGGGGGLGKAGAAGGPGIKGNSWQGGTLVDQDGVARYYPACGPYNSGVYQAGALGGIAGKSIQGNAFVRYDVKGNLVGPVS